MRRAIELEGLGITLEISTATPIKQQKGNPMIHLDQLNDGTWRLIYSEKLIEDFSKVKSLKVIREDD